MIRTILFVAAFAAVPALAEAQTVRSLEQQGPAVPRHMMPPPGKCRIWMDGVAPERQPAPTDCQTALRQRPANGRVVFGPSDREDAETGFRQRTEPRRPAPSPVPSRVPSRVERSDTAGRAAPPRTQRIPKDTGSGPARRRPEPTS